MNASHRTSGNVSAVRGHVVILINKYTKAASTIHWTSNKIEREIHSSAAAETIAMRGMFDTIFFVKGVLEEMCGRRVSNLQCVAFSNNQELLSNIRHIKSNAEAREGHSDILELRRSIEQEKVVQEVRYVCPSLNIAEVLTKTTKMKGMLQHLVQTGRYDLPGGFFVKDSTMTSVGTRYKSTRMEQRREGSQGERWYNNLGLSCDKLRDV